jgi:hypothetical protein
MDYQELKKKKNTELKTLCKEQGLKQDGKKEILIQRLLLPQESDKKSVNIGGKQKVYIDIMKEHSGEDMVSIDNKHIKQLCVKHGFGNAFDITKIDYRRQLPEFMRGIYSIFHKGDGSHYIVKVDAFMDYTAPTVIKDIIKKENFYEDTTCNSESDIFSVMDYHKIHIDFMEFKNPDKIQIGSCGRRRLPSGTEYKITDNLKITLATSGQIEIDGQWICHFSKTAIFAEIKGGKKSVNEFDMKQIYNLKLFYESQPKWKREGWTPVYLFITKTDTSIDVYQYDFKDETMMSMYLVKSVRYQWTV